jgi:hypothetical protein
MALKLGAPGSSKLVDPAIRGIPKKAWPRYMRQFVFEVKILPDVFSVLVGKSCRSSPPRRKKILDGSAPLRSTVNNSP